MKQFPVIDAQEVAELRYLDGLTVPGNTYDFKATLKKNGCLWHAGRRVWVAPDVGTRDAMAAICGTTDLLPQSLRHVATDSLREELERRGFTVTHATAPIDATAAAIADDIDDDDLFKV